MKNYILFYVLFAFLLPFHAMGQSQTGYDAQWTKVDSVLKKGLSRSAWDLTKEIYKKAVKEGNSQQQIKAIVYQLTYREAIEEDAPIKNIREMDSITATASGVTKSLLQNLSANLYLNYANRNRYAIQHRPYSTAETNEDPATWSLPHFYFHIDSLFQESLQNQETLEKLKVKDYLTIIDSGKNSLYLRPTLFDVLAHNALEFYTSKARFYKEPAAHFVMDNPVVFDRYKKFINHKWTSKDSLSPTLKALKLYQRLIQSHLKDIQSDALIDVNLERIRYAYQHSVLPEKDSLYTSALRHVSSYYAIAAKYNATAMLADWYFQKGQSYKTSAGEISHTEDHQWALKKALDLCNQVPDTIVNKGAVRCRQIRHDILKTALKLESENVNLPDKPFLVLVSYKNITDIWFKIVSLNDDPKAVFNKSLTLSELSKKKTITSWHQSFPLPGDYQEHSAEMKVNALPVGRYALIASPDSTFEDGNEAIVSLPFHVSGLSYITDSHGGLLVLDRETGKPIKKAKVELWKKVYNTGRRKYVIEKAGRYKTDKNGYIKLSKKVNRTTIIPEVTTKKDYLFIGNGRFISLSNSNSNADIRSDTAGELFADRSIYRPGQTLYYKGIIYRQSANEKNTLLKDKNVRVYLYDGNYRIIDSASLKSNNYGSFAGTFELPSSLMNGRWHIAIDSANATYYFHVENYKRPTYDLQWDSIALRYRLGDTIPVSGKIMGYNGAPMGNATVKYQVTRKRYYNPYYRGISYYPVSSAVVSEGSVESLSNGNFSLYFPAIPDQDIPEGQRIFNYEIDVDVTDIAGESHHYTYNIPVGDRSILLHLGMKDKVNKKELDSLKITSTDLNGRFSPTQVALSVYKLKSPNRFIKKRYWDQPDQYIMDEKQFLSYFPHDEYKNEKEVQNWPINTPVYVSTEETNKSGKIPFLHYSLQSGWYLIKAKAKDKYGQFVTDSQYIRIYNSTEHTIPYPEMLWTNTNEITAQPGSEAGWQIGSSDKVYVFSELKTGSDISAPDRFKLNDRIRDEKYTVKDIPGQSSITKEYVTIRYNRIIRESIRINIPQKEDQLHISYETFRNKILPGAKETWTVKITGPDQEKVNAELLASMYDASLDYFYPHRWNGFGNSYPYYYTPSLRWDDMASFGSENSSYLHFPKDSFNLSYNLIYPKFIGGYSLANLPINNVRNLLQGKVAGIGLKREAISGDIQIRGLNEVVVGYASSEKSEVTGSTDAAPAPSTEENSVAKTPIIRSNFNETAFFYPQLHTDDSGNVSFTFTSPEALTRWKLMLFAHSEDMKLAYSERETVTQKPLMIQLNAPRFVRQGDQLALSAKVTNLSDKIQSGHAVLNFKNTVTGKTIFIVDSDSTLYFNISPGESKAISWQISVPADFSDALTYTVKAISENHSDGEQNIIPVLTNKERITESNPFYFSGNGTHTIQWDALSKLNNKKAAIQPESITLEYTGNPVWYAVQALPFLDNENSKSAGAIFRKIYSNSLSRYVALKIPDFKSVMQDWLTTDTNALKSPLQKNQELKNILLEETPWINNATSEAAQKAKVAHWYEDKEEQLKLNAAIIELQQLQLNNGGFSWFKDMPDSRFITQEIITGLGRMKSLHAWPHIGTNILQQITNKAIPYLDARMKEEYNALKKDSNLNKHPVSPTDIQYLYMRSFFPNIAMVDSVKDAYSYFYNKAKQDWVSQNTYSKAMLAIAFHRKNKDTTAKEIIKSLEETAIPDKKYGTHWKQTPHAFYWYQAAVPTQAVCIEAFHELGENTTFINELRKWLLSQKQTQFWGTGTATADAVYALLLSGTEWTSSAPEINIRLGDTTIIFGKGKTGLQYEKVRIPKEKISPEMKDITVNISGAAKGQPTWGAAYFQYFENMNLVKKGGSELHIERQISKETNTPQGKELSPVDKNTTLQVGDKVQVKLIVKADRDLDFVHLKDVRASSMEPIQALSGYRWNNGVGYYTTVSDAAVHFYFRRLPKGTYVFTYPVYITQKGDFTGGLSQIECLYAPEVRAHSEGVNLKIK